MRRRNRGTAFDPVFPAYGFSGNPKKLQLSRFSWQKGGEPPFLWEKPAEVAFMYWNVPYGELKEFINSGNFAENIDGILSYESEEDC